MEDRSSNLDPEERDDAVLGDAELEALETDLSPVLGARGPARDEGAPAPEFRARLAEAFVSGRFEGDGSIEPSLERVLRSWTPPAATPAGRAAALDALIHGDAAQMEVSSEAPSEAATVRPAAAPARRNGHDRPRRSSSSAPAPTPARSTSTRLRLVVGSSLLAAAAAVVLIVKGVGGAGSPIDDTGSGARTETVVAKIDWTLDTPSREVFTGAEAFDGVRVDGSAVASIAELEEALVSGRRVENGAEKLRLRRGDRFVVEIDAGGVIDLGSPPVQPGSNAMTLFAEAGSIRVATGPGFDSTQPLVVTTPHVRTEVVGTIFGVDVTPGYTCVCCLEGKVHTIPVLDQPDLDVEAAHTRVLLADGRSIQDDLVPDHGRGLEVLRGRIDEQGYWL